VARRRHITPPPPVDRRSGGEEVWEANFAARSSGLGGSRGRSRVNKEDNIRGRSGDSNRGYLLGAGGLRGARRLSLTEGSVARWIGALVSPGNGEGSHLGGELLQLLDKNAKHRGCVGDWGRNGSRRSWSFGAVLVRHVAVQYRHGCSGCSVVVLAGPR
jgi:hypothetical protein